MKHRAASKAAARRREKRAAQAGDELAEIMVDAAARQARAVVAEYRKHVRPQAKTLTQFGVDDMPTPPVADPSRWWLIRMWDAALDEAEGFISRFVVDEIETDFGLAVASEQPFVVGLTARLVARLDNWSQDFKATVAQVVDQGHTELKSIKQVADDLRAAGVSTQRQATTIARTQMVAASNEASFHGASTFAEPGDMRRWLATDDARTRKDHADADGQEVPFDQPFVVGGERGMHPGASSFSAEQSINCRCTWVWVPN